MSGIVRVLVWSAVLQVVLVTFSYVEAAAADGQNLYEKRCSACHKLPDPEQPPPLGWAEQLDLMAPLARLKKAQKQSVLDYLMEHSQQAAMSAVLDEDRKVFEDKCSRCHTLDRVLLSPLHGESLQHIVNRMQNRSGTDWISDEDIDRILTYLDSASREEPPVEPLDGNLSPAEVFEVRCSACHTLERVFQQLGDDASEPASWSHTVSRMREKAPQWMTEQEASEILGYLQENAAEHQ